MLELHHSDTVTPLATFQSGDGPSILNARPRRSRPSIIRRATNAIGDIAIRTPDGRLIARDDTIRSIIIAMPDGTKILL